MDLFTDLARQGAMIERLTADSRGCAPGDCFFAWPGERADGRSYIEQAIARDVAAVVWEREGFDWREQWRVPNAGVSGLKAQAGHLAHTFYGRPSESLWVCGITGTNGKTSCSQWLAALLARTGERAAVIGTLGNGFPGELAESAHTTPDALELHRLLADFRRNGARAVAMEVSSHGLDQGRVNGVAFRCALFTNLSHDHLDYHGAMAAYAEAKASLFEARGLEAAVLNLDDPLGVQLAQRVMARGVRTIGYGLAPAAARVDGRIVAREVRAAAQATRVALVSSWGEAEITLNADGPLQRRECARRARLPGRLRLAVCQRRGAAGAAAGRCRAVCRRLAARASRCSSWTTRTRPDALEKVLQALRPVAQARGGRLWIVSSGPAATATRQARADGSGRVAPCRRVVLTSDNPRGEDPLAIIARGSRRRHDTLRGGARSRGCDRAARCARHARTMSSCSRARATSPSRKLPGGRLPFSDVAVRVGGAARWTRYDDEPGRSGVACRRAA